MDRLEQKSTLQRGLLTLRYLLVLDRRAQKEKYHLAETEYFANRAQTPSSNPYPAPKASALSYRGHNSPTQEHPFPSA